jgi:DNA helicase II / ATP-dependent DNA helicase PcrA
VEPTCYTVEQRALIEADVSTYVNACPGAGKTQAIVERFIARPATPERRRGIALLSFTNAAVDAARSRCGGAPSLLASPNFVGTIDAFINRFIVAPLYTTRTKRPATFRDTWSAVPGTRITVSGVRGAFELAWFQISFADRAVLRLERIPVALRGSVKNLEPYEIEAVEQAAFTTWTRQIQRGVFDAATARLLMTHYLGKPEVRAQLTELLASRFVEVIVDEAQDCSKEDILLLELLKGAGVRLILVGDPDQGIYGFRGGSAAELDSLRQELKESDRLNGNFRSSPAICATVDSLRSTPDKDQPRGRHANMHEPIHVVSFGRNREVEPRATAILNACGMANQEAMVLAHTWADARACAGAGSEPAEQSGRLARFAQAVHMVVSEGSSLPAARGRALDQVGRILRELGSVEDQALSHDEFLKKHDLTPRSHRYACLQVAVAVGDPYAGPPKLFRERFVTLKALQARLAWSPTHLTTPPGNKWPASPRPSASQLRYSTIHGFKGLQAPAVVLVIPQAGGPDDGATAWIEGRDTDGRRVLYVGASRAQRLLVLAIHDSMLDKVTGVLSRDSVPFVIEQTEGRNTKKR